MKTTIIDTNKYLGIPYKHGGDSLNGLNCYGLVKLFYLQEFGVELFDYRYEEDWDKKGFNYIQEKYRSQWQKVDKPEHYCGVGFRLPGHSIEHHLGVVLPDLNSFLHSPLNQESRIESLAHPIWGKAVTGFYKHREMPNDL